jgi:FkbM family methyltransferase
MSNIPIIIICHNNYKYVDNTIKQISKINNYYYNNIKIMDNCSTCIKTKNFLKNIDIEVIYRNFNYGPWIEEKVNSDIYHILPHKFILTDPDLEFNENIPTNFIQILSELSDKYQCHKIGFALDISDYNKMYQLDYVENKNIYDWEKQFWENKIYDDNYELYNALIDTTFCLINKSYHSNHIRVANNFLAKHLPWYLDNKIYNIYNLFSLYNNAVDNISTFKKVIFSYINNNYFKITKNDESFFIKNTPEDPNLSFWNDIYSTWENDTFEILDKFLNKDKIFIDIGAWIGPTSIYGSRKSKHVFSIEADNLSFYDLSFNLYNNCDKNYTLINKAIYNIDNIEIKFGKNKFLTNSNFNDSTSHIYDIDIHNIDSGNNHNFYFIQTITLKNIINNYNIDPSEISLIKVDIEGGEENILNDLYHLNLQYNVPLYISFHYDWWKDKSLDRFGFLSQEQKNQIIMYPFTSLLFT